MTHSGSTVSSLEKGHVFFDANQRLGSREKCASVGSLDQAEGIRRVVILMDGPLPAVITVSYHLRVLSSVCRFARAKRSLSSQRASLLAES